MADSISTRFRCLGLVEAFVSSKKTPCKKAVLKEVQFGNAAGVLVSEIEVKLAKSTRKKIKQSVEPGDWVRVEGKCKVNARSGEVKWKANKISRLSSKQAKRQRHNFEQRAIASALAEPPSSSNNQYQEKQAALQPQKAATLKPLAKAKQKPPKVLICQKSSCRKKGSMKVSTAVKDELAKAGRLDDVQIKATGCMKHCKAGPNMVILPSKKNYKKVTPKQARSLIKAAL